MKKLTILTLLSLAIACKAPMYTIGMDEQTFLHNNKVTAVEQTETASVYKKVNYPFGTPPVTKFFYFQNSRLVRVDEGVRRPDVIIDQTVRHH